MNRLRRKTIHTRWILRLLLLIAGCGQPEILLNVTPTALPATMSVSGNTAVPTPTLIKKFVFETEVAIGIATEAVQTAPPLPPMTFPPQPTLEWETGFLQNCTEAYGRQLLSSGCWQDRVGDMYVSVYAGALARNPDQGVVFIEKMDLRGHFLEPTQIYTTPLQLGKVGLVRVQYPYVDVDTDEMHFVLNVEGGTWEDPSVFPTPAPTSTVPTDTPTPTATPTSGSGSGNPCGCLCPDNIGERRRI